MIEGFDGSGFSGNIDFAAAFLARKRFFFGRVGRGVPDTATNPSGIDIRWTANKYNSLQAGLKTGGYWRFFPSVDLETQCRRFVEALDLEEGMLEPLVDIEDAANLGPQQLTDWAIEVLERVEALARRRPTLYTGKNFYDTKLQYWRLWKWKLCIAWQTTGKWREYGAHFWQYLLDTNVPWATGRVDLQKYAFDDMSLETYQNELLYRFDEDGMLHGPLVHSDKLLPESGKQGTQANTVFIVHTMVGFLNGTDASFRNEANGLESSLGIGGQFDPVGLDGAIYQWMKLWDRADANYNGNPYAFSVETSDGTRYLERWSVLQAESLAQSGAAWCLATGNPAELVDRSHWSVPGIGHHRIGTVPNPEPGDDYWSPPELGYRACPGDTRIEQLVNEVIPRINAILNSLDGSTGGGGGEGEIDMQLDDFVGISKDGATVYVKDALLAAYEANRETIQIAEALSKLPEETRAAVLEKINRILHRELQLAGQPSWDSQKTEGKTWGSIKKKKWADINKSD